MKSVSGFAALIVLLCLGSLAWANITIPTDPVGDPGNAGELSGEGAGGMGPDRLCGSVGYLYNIGTYEVTAAQYCDFLGHKAKTDPHGLYNPDMAIEHGDYAGCRILRDGVDGEYTYSVSSDRANRPVNYVGFWDCLRFANWLHNGQGDGDTETGAYTLNGYNGQDGRDIQRNPGAKWFLTSEDEWYKAAYYKGGGTNEDYWDYPTSSDDAPGRDMNDASGNNANYRDGGDLIGDPYYRTEVGEFQNSDSPYGTFDQGGNVCEWNESIVQESPSVAYRGFRGGAYSYSLNDLLASWRQWSTGGPAGEAPTLGFRVAEAVPEPSSLLALGSGLLALAGMIRKRR